jgi:hypothetical protein
MPAQPASATAAGIEIEPREVIMAALCAAGLHEGVERTGIEPVTSGLQSRRSPS